MKKKVVSTKKGVAAAGGADGDVAVPKKKVVVKRARAPAAEGAEAPPTPKPQQQRKATEITLLDNEETENHTFESIGLCPELCKACNDAGWRVPTRIQAATVPTALQSRDLIGVAQTGSGKTGSYVLPTVHWLLMQKTTPHLSVLVLVPTRELAVQVADAFVMLGASVGLRVVTLVGGLDMVTQACELSRKPHVIVGTPGRVKDHLVNTKGFRMVKLHTLILDEADKMLDMDYEAEIDVILQHLPRERQTMLFSATLTTKIDRLQQASLKDPVMLRVHRKNSTVQTLKQFFIFVPYAQMLGHLHCYLTQETGNHIIVFCPSSNLVHKVTLTLRVLGHRALPLMGKMTQENRHVALTKFKENKVRILVATDLAQRGLDIASVDVVVNYSMPLSAKDYIHRVGRTARAGSNGKAVNFVSQYDVLQLQNVESATGVKCDEMVLPAEDVSASLQRVEEAEAEAVRQMKEHDEDTKLGNQADNEVAPQVKRRRRAATEQMTYNDAGRETAVGGGPGHGVMRMRRQNEEVFQMTKSKQRNALHKHRKNNRT